MKDHLVPPKTQVVLSACTIGSGLSMDKNTEVFIADGIIPR